MIFTYVCAFEVPQEREYLTSLADLFKNAGGEFYFVELSADLETRIARNETPHRMERKASKRDAEINNTNLLPDEVAEIVIKKYKLVANEKEEKEYRFGV